MYKTAIILFLLQGQLILSGCGGGASGTGGTSTSSSSSLGGGSSSSTSGGTGGSGTGGATSTGTGGAGGAASHACPTTGTGAIQVPGGVTCLAMTPIETGASSSGQNADKAHYALYPSSTTTPKGQLVLFMNGSMGDPAHAIATPSANFYDTAVSLGYAVLAVSYRSDTEIALLCAGAGADACFYPTRQTLVLGKLQPGAAQALADPQTGIKLDEGIAGRAVLALEWLAQNDPSHPWSSFLLAGDGGADPASRLDWSNIVAAGHSQGGGHATAIGKMFATRRVLQLSAPCDSVMGNPATWLSATNGSWATDPSMSFYGLDVTGDLICASFAKAWQALAMPASRSNAAAMTCSSVPTLHGASIGCASNAPNWQAMLQ